MTSIFNEENCRGLNAAITSNRSDVEILKAIRDKKIAITSYDFDGKKHRAADCDTLIANLQEEIDAQLNRQQELDKHAFLFFLRQSNTDTDRIKANYRRFRALSIRNEAFVTIVNNLLKRLSPFYTGKISLAQVRTILDLLKRDEEAALKAAYRQLLENWPASTTGPDFRFQGRIRDFLSKNYVYFLNDAFLDNELNELTGLAREVATDLNRQQFESYKKLLEAQAEGLQTNS